MRAFFAEALARINYNFWMLAGVDGCWGDRPHLAFSIFPLGGVWLTSDDRLCRTWKEATNG